MNSQRTGIMVSAYACEPNKGSEPGVGWHWVLEMSRYFEVWVLTRRSNRKAIEEWLLKNADMHQLRYLHFNYYDPPAGVTFWKKKMRGVRLYYHIWQYGANRHIERIMASNKISVFHLLTYGNALWPISRYGQKKFFIWGPTGGLDVIESEYSRHYSYKSRIIEFIRRIAIKGLFLNIGFRLRCKNADLVLCKTQAALDAIPRQYGSKAMLCTDVAADIIENKVSIHNAKSTIEFITVGKLDAWRGFDLIIEAFSEAFKRNQNIRLKIIGKGVERRRLQKLMARRGLEHVITMTGEITMEEYHMEMASCDAVINACLKEGAVTNAFDCITYGKPFICVDTGGYTRYFSEDYAIVLPRLKRDELIKLLTNSILNLVDPAMRKMLGERIQKKATEVSWEIKGKEIRDIITRSLEKSNR